MAIVSPLKISYQPEYHSLSYVHSYPLGQHVEPENSLPPHCSYGSLSHAACADEALAARAAAMGKNFIDPGPPNEMRTTLENNSTDLLISRFPTRTNPLKMAPQKSKGIDY